MEEESRVLRLEREDVTDLMFSSPEERERFCLGLDYCRKISSKTPASDLFLWSPVSPGCLLTSSLQWWPTSGWRLEFLGRHFYLLQTEHREVRSLRPAELFIK